MRADALTTRLITLGRLTLFDQNGAEDTALSTRRRKLVVLTMLAMSRRPIARDSLIEMFWGDQDENRARHSLSDTLSHLRRVLGASAISHRRAEVELAETAELEVDALLFTNAVREERWSDALALYGGPFLEAVYVGGSPGLEQWIDQERARLDTLFTNACKAECARLTREREWRQSAAVARRWLERAPLSPHAALYRLQGVAADGSPESEQQALDEYHRLVKRLRADFDCQPDRTVASAAQEIADRVAARQATVLYDTSTAVVATDHGTVVATDHGTVVATNHGTVAATTTPLVRRPLWVRNASIVLASTAAVIVIAASVPAVRDVMVNPDPNTRLNVAATSSAAAQPLVLFTDFTSAPAEASLAHLVSAVTRMDLARSTSLRVLDFSAMRQGLERMRRPLESAVDSSTARELAIREGADWVMRGSVTTTTNGIVVSVDLIAPTTDVRLWSTSEVARDSTELVAAIERLSRALRLYAGERTTTVQATVALSTVTTSSLEALKRYTLGTRAYERDGDREEAIRLLESAIALDSGFAMAYRRLGTIYNNDIEAHARTTELLTQAFRHAARLPERERFLTIGTYHTSVTGEYGRASAAYRSLLQLDPNDALAWNSLGTVFQYIGDQQRAADAYAMSARFNPHTFSAWVNLSDARYALGDVAGAWSALDSLSKWLPGHPSLFMRTAALAQSEGELAKAEQQLRALAISAPESPRLQSVAHMLLAKLLWAAGRVDEGNQARVQSIAVDRARGALSSALQGELELSMSAIWLQGDTAAARRRIAQALERVPLVSLPLLDRPYLDLALAHGVAGNAAAARRTLTLYEDAMPVAMRRQSVGSEHLARGALAMAERRHSDAIREFASASEPLCIICGLPELGLAYERNGQADSALLVYRRYVSTKSLRRADATDGFHRKRVDEGLRRLSRR